MVRPRRSAIALGAFDGPFEVHHNVRSALSLVHVWTVPDGRVWSPASGDPFSLDLWVSRNWLDVNADLVSVTMPPHALPPLVPPAAGGGEPPLGTIEVLNSRTPGGTINRLTVTGRDTAAKSWTFSPALTAGDMVDVAYIPDVPMPFALFLVQPEVMGSRKKELMSGDMRTLLLRDPFNKRTASRFTSPTVFPPGWRIELHVDVPFSVAWFDQQTPPQPLPYRWQVPIVEEMAFLYPDLDQIMAAG